MNVMGIKALRNKIIMDLMFMSLCVAMSFESRLDHKCHSGNIMLDGNVMTPKIHWELNWLNQWDPQLIEFIKNHLLIPPPKYSMKNLNLRNKYDPDHAWKYQGQHGQAIAVEYLHGLKPNGSIADDKGLIRCI